MVRIFKDAHTGEHVIQTSCLDVDSFTAELSEAIAEMMNGKNVEPETVMGVLSNSMPIAFKLAGYKAENVNEQRTLVCGNVSPNACELVSSVGK
jgi:hypothetical protein